MKEDIFTDTDFSRLSQFIHSQVGIKISEGKKTMLQTRLQKRLRSLNIPSYSGYCDYLFSEQGIREELAEMINAVTTNKTDFFRESGHFDYLAGSVLPDLISGHKYRTGRKITVWSAGCSTGEEPYTLAIVLKEFVRDRTDLDFLILASDISTKVLEKARLGIYNERAISAIPEELRKRYLLKSKESDRRLFRIEPELRSHVAFGRLNLMDRNFVFRRAIDIIFCRNVIIYFDRPTQERLLANFCKHLSSHGYLFLGHSETLVRMDLPLRQVSPTVYKKTA